MSNIKFISAILCTLMFAGCAEKEAIENNISETAVVSDKGYAVSSESAADKITNADETENVSEEYNDYIVTDTAENLTIEKLNPLIETARDYMMESQTFKHTDGEWVIEDNSENSGKTIEQYISEYAPKMKEVFTNKLVDSIALSDTPANEDKYVYSLGNKSTSEYGYGGDRGIDETYLISDWQIEVVSDTEVKLIHQAFYSAYPEATEGDEPVYFKEHVLLNEADDSVHELRTYDNRSERLETYYYTLVWEDEHWKFDDFALWY